MTETVLGEVRMVPLSQLQADPDWERTTEGSLDQESLQELTNSIKERGVLEPLRVYELGADKYLINSGHRRAIASRAAGLSGVPVYVLPRSQERVDEQIARLTVNLQRKDISPIEKAKAFQSLIDATGLTKVELSRQLGLHQQVVGMFTGLLRLPVEVQQFFDSGAIAWPTAHEFFRINVPEYDANGLTGRSAADIQLEFAQLAVQTNMGRPTLSQRITDYLKQQTEYIAKLHAKSETPLEIVTERKAGARTTQVERELIAHGITVRPSEPPAQSSRVLQPSSVEFHAENEKNRVVVLGKRRTIASGVLVELLSTKAVAQTGLTLDMVRLVALLALDNPNLRFNRAPLREALNSATTIDQVHEAMRQIVVATIELDVDNRRIVAPPVVKSWANEELELDLAIEVELERAGLVGATKTPRLRATSISATFISPTGERVEVNGLHAFCEQQMLDHRAMKNVALGKRAEFRGWTLAPDQPVNMGERTESYRLVSPSGELFEIPPTMSVAAWCRTQGLVHSSIVPLLQGKAEHHKGWRLAPEQPGEVGDGE